MKRKHLFLIIIFGIISLLTTWYYFIPVQTTEYEAMFHVEGPGTAGFDVTTENLYFGIVPTDGHNTKYLELQNNEERVKVVIAAKGDIAEHISVSDNDFFLEPFEQKNVTFTASGKNADMRTYKGLVHVYFYRPFFN
jgi:hypothetical protein